MCGGGGTRCRCRRQQAYTPIQNRSRSPHFRQRGSPTQQTGCGLQAGWADVASEGWSQLAASGSLRIAGRRRRLRRRCQRSPAALPAAHKAINRAVRASRDIAGTAGNCRRWVCKLARRSAGQPVGWVRASAAGEQGGKGRQDGRSTGASAARFDAGSAEGSRAAPRLGSLTCGCGCKASTAATDIAAGWQRAKTVTAVQN